jgi:hypothetical protein
MPINKSQIKKGAFLIAGGGECHGHFVSRRGPLPHDLQHFEAASREADRLAEVEASADARIVEIRRRLDAAGRQIEDLRRVKRK